MPFQVITQSCSSPTDRGDDHLRPVTLSSDTMRPFTSPGKAQPLHPSNLLILILDTMPLIWHQQESSTMTKRSLGDVLDRLPLKSGTQFIIPLDYGCGAPPLPSVDTFKVFIKLLAIISQRVEVLQVYLWSKK